MPQGCSGTHPDKLPRSREPHPEGFGEKIIFTGSREHSATEALARMLLPNEYARVEKIRISRRKRLLPQTSQVDAVRAETVKEIIATTGQHAAAAETGQDPIPATQENAVDHQPANELAPVPDASANPPPAGSGLEADAATLDDSNAKQHDQATGPTTQVASAATETGTALAAPSAEPKQVNIYFHNEQQQHHLLFQSHRPFLASHPPASKPQPPKPKPHPSHPLPRLRPPQSTGYLRRHISLYNQPILVTTFRHLNYKRPPPVSGYNWSSATSEDCSGCPCLRDGRPHHIDSEDWDECCYCGWGWTHHPKNHVERDGTMVEDWGY